jgi:hypothetical protein
MSLSGPHTITFSKDGKTQEYLFDKNSMDVEFVKYVKNTVICESPRTEEIIELWHINSLDRDVEVKRTLKYTPISKVAERRDWKPYGIDCNDTMGKATYGDDVFIEWSPSILNNHKNKEYVEKYCNDNYRAQYSSNIPKTTQDLIYINTNIEHQFHNMDKHSSLIERTNNISNSLTKINRNRSMPSLLPTAKSYVENNLITKSKSKDDNGNTLVKDIAKTSRDGGDSDGFFVPVHKRSGFKNMMHSRRSPRNRDQNLFKVHKRLEQPKFTFVIKGIPDPHTVTHNDILEALCRTSHTLRGNPNVASVFILKDKQSNRQKNMCLVNFRKEDIKNQVLQECQSSRVLFNSCILEVEDGRNN